jgi:hypothetical protein
MDRGTARPRIPESHLPVDAKDYFLRVDPRTETAKGALESTLPQHSRDWETDLVRET